MSRRRSISLRRPAQGLVAASLWFWLSSFAPSGQVAGDSAIAFLSLAIAAARTVIYMPLPNAALLCGLAGAPVAVWLVRHCLYRTRRTARRSS